MEFRLRWAAQPVIIFEGMPKAPVVVVSTGRRPHNGLLGVVNVAVLILIVAEINLRDPIESVLVAVNVAHSVPWPLLPIVRLPALRLGKLRRQRREVDLPMLVDYLVEVAVR